MPANASETKMCTKCGKDKPLAEYHKDRARQDGLRTWCKACSIRVAKTWNQENAWRQRENQYEWRRRNPDYHRQWRARQKQRSA